MSESIENIESNEDNHQYIVRYPYVDTENNPTGSFVDAGFPDEISAYRYMKAERKKNPELNYELLGPTGHKAPEDE